jgi:hypothetical protein
MEDKKIAFAYEEHVVVYKIGIINFVNLQSWSIVTLIQTWQPVLTWVLLSLTHIKPNSTPIIVPKIPSLIQSAKFHDDLWYPTWYGIDQ